MTSELFDSASPSKKSDRGNAIRLKMKPTGPPKASVRQSAPVRARGETNVRPAKPRQRAWRTP
jgi:hypothetical protein